MKRDSKNKLIFGVCSGIAKHLNVNIAIVRVLFLLLTLMGFGMPVIIYLVLAIVMPVE
jgi:phage shock protein PspC (stress-responsive transcriptional regulator)